MLRFTTVARSGLVQYVPLNDKGHISLALSNKGLYAKTQPQRLVSALLWHVASGNQKTAQEMLKKYPNLLLKRGTVTDYSGRTFEKITAFEYALWALDVRYMCPMMLDCLPQNEEGEKIRIALLEQYKHLEKEGLTYTFNGKTISNEKHYDISHLTSVLKTYLDNYKTSLAADKYNNYWNTFVRGEQFKTVAHVAQHYCELDVPFAPPPSFKAKTFNRVLDVYHCNTYKSEKWWTRDIKLSESGLASSFCIVKGKGVRPRAFRSGYAALPGSLGDLVALTALWTVRTEEDLPQLNQRLQNRIQKPDSAPGPGCMCTIV